MDKKQILLTKEGYDKLVEEVKYLKGPKKMEVAEKIKIAREFGDLSENAEYDEARNEQAFLESKIIEYEEMLRNVKIVEKVSIKTVGIGVTVKLYDYEEKEVIDYEIVGTTEINPLENRISLDSPIGFALQGKKKEDEIEVATPVGISKYKILDITKTK